jgi:hypothetical protein
MEDLPLPEFDITTIVLLGSFNPRIFHPAWFVRQGLLPPSYETESNIEVLSNDISIVDTGWCRLEVLNERFAAQSTETPVLESMRDLVQGTFEILRHTPITKMGINSSAHFQLRDEESWHTFGNTIAPKSGIWNAILEKPGTLSLTINGKRPDDLKGHVNIKVEPSAQLTFGIFIETNEEFQKQQIDTDLWVSEILGNHWEASQERVRKIREHLVRLAVEGISDESNS